MFSAIPIFVILGVKYGKKLVCSHYFSDIQVISTIVPTIHILAANGLVSYSTITCLPSSSFMWSNFLRFVGSNFLPFSRTSTHEQPSSPVKFFRVAVTPLGHRILSSLTGAVVSIVLIGLLHDKIVQQTIKINIVTQLQTFIPFCIFCV